MEVSPAQRRRTNKTPPAASHQNQPQDVFDLLGITADDLNVAVAGFGCAVRSASAPTVTTAARSVSIAAFMLSSKATWGRKCCLAFTLVMLNLAQYKAVPPQLPYKEQTVLISEKQRINKRIHRLIEEIVMGV